MIYLDYPTANFKYRNGSVTFNVKGDERLNCRMLLVKDKKPLPEFSVEDQNDELEGIHRKDGHIEFLVKGDQHIKINWK